MYEELEEFLSRERLQAYLETYGSKENALLFYKKNIIISHSFYVFLQFIEIGLRNKINKALVKDYGENWFLNNTLLLGENKEKGLSTIAKIQNTIKKIEERKREKNKEVIVNNCDIVSSLDFGFWTNVFCGNYANTLWSQCLKHEFKEFKRKDLYNKLNRIRNIRNRIFHYEPIIKDRNEIKNLLLIQDILEYLFKKNIVDFIYEISDLERFFERYKKTKKT